MVRSDLRRARRPPRLRKIIAVVAAGFAVGMAVLVSVPSRLLPAQIADVASRILPFVFPGIAAAPGADAAQAASADRTADTAGVAGVAGIARIAESAGSTKAAPEPALAAKRASAGRPHKERAARPARKPLDEWLAGVAAQAGRGVVIDPRVSGEVSAVLDNVDWRLGLEALARTVGFDFEVGEDLIEVRRTSPSSHAGHPGSSVGLSVDAPGAVRAEPEAGLRPGPKPGPRTGPSPSPRTGPEAGHDSRDDDTAMRILALSSGRSRELAESLQATVRGFNVTADADPVAGAVVLTGPSGGVELAAALFQELDVPRRPVRLEAEIVEISRSAREELGIQWHADGRFGAQVDLPAADAPGESAALLFATAGSRAVSARLAALESAGRVRIISRPRVVVLEGRAARIESVRVLRIRLPDRTSLLEGEAGLSVGGNSRAVEEIPVGVSMHVSPQILAGGRVLLEIEAESSTLGPPQPPDGIPEEFSRLVEAELVVASGETAVLGGLLRRGSTRSGTGVPGLRSIPVLGHLFGKRSTERETEELLVLVTPTIIGAAAVAAGPGSQ